MMSSSNIFPVVVGSYEEYEEWYSALHSIEGIWTPEECVLAKCSKCGTYYMKGKSLKTMLCRGCRFTYHKPKQTHKAYKPAQVAEVKASTVHHNACEPEYTKVNRIGNKDYEICDLYGCKGSLVCACCKRGINYVTGTKDVSSRRCPDHPIAGDGSRYIFRTTHGQNTDDNKRAKTMWYRIGDSPEFSTVRVERRVQRVGSEVKYIYPDYKESRTADTGGDN